MPPSKPKLTTPSKPTDELLKVQQMEAARQAVLAEQAKKQQFMEKLPEHSTPKELDAEDHNKLPEFDLQDIPSAMDKIG